MFVDNINPFPLASNYPRFSRHTFSLPKSTFLALPLQTSLTHIDLIHIACIHFSIHQICTHLPCRTPLRRPSGLANNPTKCPSRLDRPLPLHISSRQSSPQYITLGEHSRLRSRSRRSSRQRSNISNLTESGGGIYSPSFQCGRLHTKQYPTITVPLPQYHA